MTLINKKILIVGGSRGIGLSLYHILKDNNKVIIANRSNPENIADFIYFDANITTNIENLPDDIDIIIICCGRGLLDSFENHSEWDIINQFNINTITPTLIIKKYYSKIITDSSFKLCIISSINSFIDSPLFSVYGASKTAISKVIANINAELKIQQINNKILNIVLTYIDGTSFYGEDTNIKKLYNVSLNIIEQIKNNNEICFLPDEKLCKSIIYDYINNKEKFIQSYYDYKLKQKRNFKFKTIGYLSGSFDYLHIGHINIFNKAKQFCDYLVVGVHKDGSHKNKQLHLSVEDRIKTLKHIDLINKIIVAPKEDIDAYANIKYDFLFVGDDYKNTERFLSYEKYFKDTEVKIIYFPYTQNISSSIIRDIK